MRYHIRTFFLFLVMSSPSLNIAWAAEAILPIKARIIRCVSYEERMQMCAIEKLCCRLQEEINANAATPADSYQGVHTIDRRNHLFRMGNEVIIE